MQAFCEKWKIMKPTLITPYPISRVLTAVYWTERFLIHKKCKLQQFLSRLYLRVESQESQKHGSDTGQGRALSFYEKWHLWGYFFHQVQKHQLFVCYKPLNVSLHSLRVHLWSVQTHLKSGQAKKTLKKDKRSHGQEAKVLKCLIMNIVIIIRMPDSFSSSSDQQELLINPLWWIFYVFSAGSILIFNFSP